MAETGRRPRVLHIATSQNDGGIERYSVHLAAGLAQKGGRQCFACLPGGIVERLSRAAGLQTFPLTVRNSGDGQAVRQIAAYIESQSIDIVHVHSRRDYLPALLGVMLARHRAPKSRTAPKLVLHAHLIRPLGTPLGLSSYVFARHADRVLAVSQAVQDALNTWHHFAPGFVQVLHNGVDLERFCAPASPTAQGWRAALRKEWKLDDDALVTAMIGRLDAKGQEQMIAVLAGLLRQVPQLRVVLVGSEGRDGKKDRLLALAQASGVAQQVVFAGTREDIPQILVASDLLAHLPTDESFGLALAEGMAAGLPTIAADVGGCREVVQDGVTGLLVPSGSPASLTQAMLSLLQGRDASERRARLGEAGRLRAEREFSLPRQIVRLEEIYQELCPNLGSSTMQAEARPSRS